jgi:hypothetical protein
MSDDTGIITCASLHEATTQTLFMAILPSNGKIHGFIQLNVKRNPIEVENDAVQITSTVWM